MSQKVLIKRGLEANRTNITPQDGELIITTDTKELYVGDGSTPGGNLVGGLGLAVREWNITTVNGQTAYTPSSEIPLRNPTNGIYLVFLSGVRVVPGDFIISASNNTITLNTAPNEDNQILSIIYIGK